MSQVITALLKEREKLKAKIEKLDQDTAAKRKPLATELIAVSRALLELGHKDEVPAAHAPAAAGTAKESEIELPSFIGRKS